VVTVVAVLVLGIPLGIAGSKLVHDEAVRQLDRQGATIGVALGDDFATGQPITVAELRRFSPTDLQVIVRDARGRVVRSRARSQSPALQSTVHLPHGESIVVRGPAHATLQRQRLVWIFVGALALAAILTTIVLARVQARRLSAPLDDLERTADRIRSGDFSSRSTPSGVREIDAIGSALDDAAERMTDTVQREREFTANASHQLRTPLTALRIRIEELLYFADDPDAVRTNGREALAQTDLLDETITAMLKLAREGHVSPAEEVAIGPLLADVADRWRAVLGTVGRTLRYEPPPEPTRVRASPAATRQALEVLLDNALTHGAGEVRLCARPIGAGVLVDVADEGPGIPLGMEEAIFTRRVSSGDGHGVGLPLARTLVEAHGGQLRLASRHPTRFQIALPVAG